MRAIGLMSGTSLDGVDAAWIDTDGEAILATGPALTLAYEPALRADLRRLLDGAPDNPAAHEVGHRITLRHAEAVTALGVSADIVGFHGQTILHRPAEGRTWQIGDAALLARMTGMRVAHDFRAADVAAGGQGAPLAPMFHAAMVRDLDKPLAVVNLGGVANVTFVGADGSLTACDTGPGNALLDDWALRHTGTPCDRDGALAAAGQVDAAVLQRLLDHPFFRRPAPKSLDRQDFADHSARCGLLALAAADGAATLVAFTAGAIAATPIPAQPRRWLVTGGGRHNPCLMQALSERLCAPVQPIEALGWNGDAVEAQCFGFLAVRTALGLPITLPGTTGVARPWLGGSLVGPI